MEGNDCTLGRSNVGGDDYLIGSPGATLFIKTTTKGSVPYSPEDTVSLITFITLPKVNYFNDQLRCVSNILIALLSKA